MPCFKTPKVSVRLLSLTMSSAITVYAKTARLSDKTGKFLFCPAENFSLSDKCPTTLCKSQILITDMFCDFKSSGINSMASGIKGHLINIYRTLQLAFNECCDKLKPMFFLCPADFRSVLQKISVYLTNVL